MSGHVVERRADIDPSTETVDLAADALGRLLVVAPHPDDESIGCGGLIALRRASDAAVFVLMLSDGEMSHPRSKRWPRETLAALRRAELDDALAALGVPADACESFGWPDGALPAPGSGGFARAVEAVARCLRVHRCDTLLVPWRRDPHPDHRAASAIARAANDGSAHPMRVLEYPVWAAERGGAEAQPRPGEAQRWRLAIGAAVDAKLRAVAAHRSQCGGLIDDDPGGFTLSASMRARCAEPWETYYEVIAA